MSASDKTPVPKIDDSKPVVWTPEDASRFLTSAIHEAQRPLADELKRRPITAKTLTLFVVALVIAALGIALVLSSQLEKTEKRADEARVAREQMFAEKATLQASSATLEERLAIARQQQDELQQRISTMQGGEEELRRAKGDIQRFRRQNELLRSQISGLEMEKVALARQLDAVRALAIDEESVDDDLPFEAPSGTDDEALISTPLDALSEPPADTGPESTEAGPAAAPPVEAPQDTAEVKAAAEPDEGPAVEAPMEPTPETVEEAPAPETPAAGEETSEPTVEPEPAPAADTPGSAFQATTEAYADATKAVREEPAAAETPAEDGSTVAVQEENKAETDDTAIPAETGADDAAIPAEADASEAAPETEESAIPSIESDSEAGERDGEEGIDGEENILAH